MSATMAPSSPPEASPRRAYSSLRDALAALRADGGTTAFAYEAVLRLTFGTNRAEELADLPKAEVRKLGPRLFGEVFDETPAEATERSLALSIFGVAGVVLLVAVLTGVAVCIDMQRLQSAAPPPTQTKLPSAVPNQAAPKAPPSGTTSNTPDKLPPPNVQQQQQQLRPKQAN
ncbi:hypothetical protein [Bradyrhizobium sp. 930_D9_N1_4]|uniref:hypothetical protein n=1 Tax=Bradyrhizobium sp. 930_D9_N1_4 TaxID=3240374 RepID=UPI003F8C6B37